MAAAKFKNQCLAVLDRVATTRASVVVTKRGRPVAIVSPVEPAGTYTPSLAGSVLRERGPAYGTGEDWDADRS